MENVLKNEDNSSTYTRLSKQMSSICISMYLKGYTDGCRNKKVLYLSQDSSLREGIYMNDDDIKTVLIDLKNQIGKLDDKLEKMNDKLDDKFEKTNDKLDDKFNELNINVTNIDKRVVAIEAVNNEESINRRRREDKKFNAVVTILSIIVTGVVTFLITKYAH